MNSYNGFTPAQRVAALKWLNREYAAGRRTRPTRCDACGQTNGLLQAHSEDYSAPFGANIGEHGLCYMCHMMIHCRFSAKRVWEDYRTRVRSGWRVKGQAKANWPLVQAALKGAVMPWERTETPGNGLLDRLGAAPSEPGAVQPTFHYRRDMGRRSTP